MSRFFPQNQTLSSSNGFSDSQPPPDDHDSIIVTEVTEDCTTTGLFGGVLNAYRYQGFEAGRTLAMHEARCATILAVADFIRERKNLNAESRHILSEFQAYLEQRLTTPVAGSYVEGGLGI